MTRLNAYKVEARKGSDEEAKKEIAKLPETDDVFDMAFLNDDRKGCMEVTESKQKCLRGRKVK